MTPGEIVAAAVVVILAFAGWMFRIDRLCTRVDTKLDNHGERISIVDKRVDRNTEKIELHHERITRLEAK